MISYQWTAAAVAVAIAAKIFFLIRRDVLRPGQAVWWLFVTATILIAGLFPKLIDRIASLAGVHYPPILFVAVGVGLMLIKMLTMDLDRSNQERRLRRLVQRLAILEAERDDARPAPRPAKRPEEEQPDGWLRIKPKQTRKKPRTTAKNRRRRR